MPDPVQPPKKDKLTILHEAVGEEYNLGTIEQFKEKMINPEKRKRFWEAVGEQYNLGDFKTFDDKITSSYPKQIPLAQPIPSPVVPGTFAQAATCPFP